MFSTDNRTGKVSKMVEKKKIAFIYTSMPIGGIEVCLINMLNVFDYSKYDVTLWLLRKEGSLLEKVPEQVKIRDWGNVTHKTVVQNHMKERSVIRLAKDCIYEALFHLFKDNYCISNKFLCDMMPPITDEKYDCFIVYHGWDYRSAYNAIKRFRADKYVLWLHCEPWLPTKYFRSISHKIDKIFCVSNAIKEQAEVKLDNYKKNNIEVLYNVSDAEKIMTLAMESCEKLRDFSIVTVGRLGIEKGQDMVPEIVRKLLDEGYDITWYLVGEGQKREIIQKRIKEYHVEENVVLLGVRDNPYPYIKNCNLYVQPSYTEGYCTTTIEAKILCKPIVVTDVPGMREQFDHMINGFIVKHPSVEDIFLGVKRMLDDSELRESFIWNLKNANSDNRDELKKLYRYMEEKNEY